MNAVCGRLVCVGEMNMRLVKHLLARGSPSLSAFISHFCCRPFGRTAVLSVSLSMFKILRAQTVIYRPVLLSRGGVGGLGRVGGWRYGKTVISFM